MTKPCGNRECPVYYPVYRANCRSFSQDTVSTCKAYQPEPDTEPYHTIRVRAVETEATGEQQMEKIHEEFKEWSHTVPFYGDEDREESCDLIQSVITYLEKHCGGFLPAWEKHMQKMADRGFKARGESEA